MEDAKETSVPSTEVNQNPELTSQGGAQTTSPESAVNEGFHNHPRFQELVSEKNQLKEQNAAIMREMESMRSQIQQNRSPVSGFEDIVQEYTNMGIERGAAEKMVLLQSKIAERKSEAAVRPLSETTLQTRVDMAVEKFVKDHNDYAELEPEMIREFNSLHPSDRSVLARLSDGGVSSLYDKVKIKKQNELLEKYKSEGRTEAYDNKALKNAVSSSPSSSRANADPSLEREELMKKYLSATEKDFRERRSEYDEIKRRLFLG